MSPFAFFLVVWIVASMLLVVEHDRLLHHLWAKPSFMRLLHVVAVFVVLFPSAIIYYVVSFDVVVMLVKRQWAQMQARLTHKKVQEFKAQRVFVDNMLDLPKMKFAMVHITEVDTLRDHVNVKFLDGEFQGTVKRLDIAQLYHLYSR